MERALKERIVGATILVAAVVIVVPVFLDGPSDPDEIVSESINLPGQAKDGSRTVVLNRDRTEPVPQPEAPPAAEPSPPAMEADEEPADVAVSSEPEEVEPEPAAPTVVEQPAPRQPPAVRSSTGMWAVQLGSFSSQENAERLASSLRKQGFAAFLSDVSTANGRLHRVRIGPQKDRQSAEAMALRLEKAGHGGQVVPHP